MKLRKIVYILLIAIASIIIVAFVFISPIAKYVIERNSEKWIGRKVKIESLWVNLFTGTVKASGIKVLENKSEKLFLSCKGFYVRVSLRKLLSSKYDVSEFKLTNPEINIIQNGNHFNYDDLVKRFADTTSSKKKTNTKPTKYWIENISVASAVINYSTTKPNASVSIINANASCPVIAYNKPDVLFKTDFDLKSGGSINAAIKMNSDSLDYNLRLAVKKLNVAFLYPYVREYMKINSLDGLVSTSMGINGNFNKPADVALSGLTEVENFSLVDNTGEKLTAVDNLKVGMDSINTKNNLYRFDTVSLNRPYLEFAMYKDGYNFDRIMTNMATGTASSDSSSTEYSNIFQMMAVYLKEIIQQYVVSDYSVDKFVIENGHFSFLDYTLEDKFRYDLDNMHIVSGNLNSKKERINIAVDSRLNNSGMLKGTISVNPDGFRDMDINYVVNNLRISDMNPYSKYYVATPFLDGIMVYESNTTIKNNKLKSANNLHIKKIEVGKKVKNKTAYNLPIRLAVSLLKDVKGNIDLDIPVSGNLNDPKYKLGKVIWDIIKNIIVKAATAPMRLLSKTFGGKEEDYNEVSFQYMQKSMTEDQLRILDNLAKVLKEKPDLKVELVQVNNKEDEMEQLALSETKKQYLGMAAGDSLSGEQSKKLDNLSNMDSLFNAWVNQKLNTTATLNSIQSRCIQYIGKEKLTAEVSQLMELRNAALANYFAQKNIPAERVKISNTKDEEQASKESSPKYVINFFTEDNQTATKEEPKKE